MKPIKHYWNLLGVQFDQLKLSERRLITATCVVTVFVMCSLTIWEPLMHAWGERNQKIASLEKQIEAMIKSREHLIVASKHDPNASLRYERDALKKQIQTQKERVASITSSLITPGNMAGVFDKLLSNSNVKLNSMMNSKALPIEISQSASERPLLYKHGLSLEMEGSYSSVLGYVRHLEQQSWKLYWDELTYKTTVYPNGYLLLKVHTLSTSDHVLGI